MSKTAFWIHGTSVREERAGVHLHRTDMGYYCRFMSHSPEWFHFAIPTPVLLEGKRAKVQKVFVLHETLNGAKITKVHVYDADTKIEIIENLSITGNFKDNIVTGKSGWKVDPNHEMQWGLGISVHVDFTPNAVSDDIPEVRFFTAGADFEV